MNLKNFPNNADEFIGAEDVMKWHYPRTQGVYGAENNLAVTPAIGLMVNVSDGVGWLKDAVGNGCVFWNDSQYSTSNLLQLTIDIADSIQDRIDRVIVSWRTANYTQKPEIIILKGDLFASNPQPPALTNDNTVCQISLAQISIPAGVTEITSSMITDERLDPSVCGIVTDAIEVDTTVINNQVAELIEQIKENLEQAVSGEILDGSITTPKLADGAVTAEKLADGAVTPESINAVNKAGDTMTGGLTIGGGQDDYLELNNITANRRVAIRCYDDGAMNIQSKLGDGEINRVGLFLLPETNELGDSFTLERRINGVSEYYNIFGEHNPLMELLWENASPTSKFLGQSVSLDLSRYNRVHIDFAVSESYSQIIGADCKVGDKFMIHYIWGDTGKYAHRTGSTTTSGVSFNTDHYSSTASDGSTCIPVRIYGIKGVG